jgi:lysophospholipase L1-like esterase
MKRVVGFFVYNIIAVCFLLAVIELTTRTISFVQGKGFTLALHELDPYNQKIKNIYKWHPFVGFTFKPMENFTTSYRNQKQISQVFIDKYSFLTKDFSLKIEKNINEFRIATIGGSTTANINLTFDQNWPGYLGNIIQKKYPEKVIRVINAGIPGFDTAQSIGNLSLRVMPFKPDLVIIYHAYNDLKAIRGDIAFKPDYSHIHNRPYGFHKEPAFFVKFLSNSMFYVRSRNAYRRMNENKALQEKNEKRLSYIPNEAKKAFQEHLQSLVAIAQAGGAEVMLSSFATLYDVQTGFTESSMKNFSELQKNDLASIYYFTPGLTVPAIFDGIVSYNKIISDVSSQKKVFFVDNARLIPHEDKYFIDRVHFSDSGAALMAKNFAPYVEQLIDNKINIQNQQQEP